MAHYVDNKILYATMIVYKDKVKDADVKIQKDLLETEAAQSMFREKMKSDTNLKLKELGLAVSDAKKKQAKK